MEEIKTNEEQLEQITEALSEAAEHNPTVKVLREVQATGAPTKEQINNVRFTAGDASPEDLVILNEINKRIKSGEKFSAYKALPASFKSFIDHEMSTYGIEKSSAEMLTRASVEALINEADMDKEFAKLKTEVDNAFGDKNIIEALFDNIKETNIDTFKKMAEKFKDDTSEAAQAQYKHFIAAIQYSEAATNYKEEFAKYIENNPSVLNRIREGGKFIKRIDRFYDDIDYEFSKNNIKLMPMRDFVKFRTMFLGLNPILSMQVIIMIKLIANTIPKKYQILYLYYAINSIINLSRANIKDLDFSEGSYAKTIHDNFIDAVKYLIYKLDEIQNV